MAVQVTPELREVRATTARGAVGQTVAVGPHRLPADEPFNKGGDDTGPAPHEFLLAALASCVSMTAQSYASRKGLVVRSVEVTVNGRHEDGAFIIQRHITIDGDLDESQRQRVLEIAGRCPVTRTLSSPIRIVEV
jgi:putative redox protein